MPGASYNWPADHMYLFWYDLLLRFRLKEAKRRDYSPSFNTNQLLRLGLKLDLDVDARRKIQLHQRINGFIRRVDDVHEAQMSTNLELIP